MCKTEEVRMSGNEQAIDQSGVSPVPHQPPHSKTLSRLTERMIGFEVLAI
jgi:hypothetical protein